MSNLISVKAVLWPQVSHFSCWPRVLIWKQGLCASLTAGLPGSPDGPGTSEVSGKLLMVTVVVTLFNPQDHPGRQELGLFHFADVETEAGER